MERQTIVLATYGASRDNNHSDLITALRYELHMLVFEVRESAQIDMARSYLATMALDHGADVALKAPTTTAPDTYTAALTLTANATP